MKTQISINLLLFRIINVFNKKNINWKEEMRKDKKKYIYLENTLKFR